MNKKIANVVFINAVSGPPHIGTETSLNIQKRRDLKMVYDGQNLILTFSTGEVIVPAGNIRSMAVLNEKDGSN